MSYGYIISTKHEPPFEIFKLKKDLQTATWLATDGQRFLLLISKKIHIFFLKILTFLTRSMNVFHRFMSALDCL